MGKIKAIEPNSPTHPKGLWVLFGTEMWERFNFYGMRALLTLFMINSLGMMESETSIIYGGFLALCYLTPMLGGFISDKYLGNRNCIILGGSLMAIGQFVMFVSASSFSSNLEFSRILLWIALGIIVFGNGFFKPNISSMVGSLYPKREKSKLDSAFTIFYMGINLGAFMGQIICPLLGDVKDADGVRDIHAFRWGFFVAGVAMVLGTLLFLFLKNKFVVTPDGRTIGGLPKYNTSDDFEEGEAQKANFSRKSVILTVFAFVLLGMLFHLVFEQNLVYSLVYSSGISLAGLIISDSSITKIERDRILVIYIVSFFVIFYWAAFEQAGSSLTFIADNQTDRNFFGWSMPPSMVQVFNGLFIVIMAVPFSMFWDKLRSRGKEPASPLKQAIGLMIMAFAYFVIANNVLGLGNGDLLAIKWLILLYFLQTCGELCISPISLSLVGKLAPKRFSSLLYGVFFISNAAGYALAGTLGSMMPATGDKFKKAEELGINLRDVLDKKVVLSSEQTDLLVNNKIPLVNQSFAGFEIHNLYEFFMVFVILCGVAGILMATISPKLKKMMHGIN